MESSENTLLGVHFDIFIMEWQRVRNKVSIMLLCAEIIFDFFCLLLDEINIPLTLYSLQLLFL